MSSQTRTNTRSDQNYILQVLLINYLQMTDLSHSSGPSQFQLCWDAEYTETAGLDSFAVENERNREPGPRSRAHDTSLVYVVSYWLSSQKSPANFNSHVVLEKQLYFNL